MRLSSLAFRPGRFAAGQYRRGGGCGNGLHRGDNVLCNNGRAAGQLIEHVHFHIIPRSVGDGVFSRWPSYKYPKGKIEAIATLIRKNL